MPYAPLCIQINMCIVINSIMVRHINAYSVTKSMMRGVCYNVKCASRERTTHKMIGITDASPKQLIRILGALHAEAKIVISLILRYLQQLYCRLSCSYQPAQLAAVASRMATGSSLFLKAICLSNQRLQIGL